MNLNIIIEILLVLALMISTTLFAITLMKDKTFRWSAITMGVCIILIVAIECQKPLGV